MPVLTTETRLSEREAHDIMEYTRKFRTDYGIIQRYVWHVIVRRKNVINKSKLNTEIQMKFSVSKRTANSVIYDMKGRYKALQELKKTERNQLKNKILRLEQQAEKTANTVNSLKKDAAANSLGKKQLIKYRDLKKKLYYKHQRIQKFRDRLVRPGDHISCTLWDILIQQYMSNGNAPTLQRVCSCEENCRRTYTDWTAVSPETTETGVADLFYTVLFYGRKVGCG